MSNYYVASNRSKIMITCRGSHLELDQSLYNSIYRLLLAFVSEMAFVLLIIYSYSYMVSIIKTVLLTFTRSLLNVVILLHIPESKGQSTGHTCVSTRTQRSINILKVAAHARIIYCPRDQILIN